MPPAVCAPETAIAASVSVNDADVSASAFAFEIVKAIVLVPSAAMEAGENDFAIVGATAFTDSVALAAATLVPFEVCSAPAARVLVKAPPLGETTSTVIVQLPGVAPLAPGMARVAGSVMEPEPAAAATAPVPAHVVDAFGVGATTSGTGSVSVSGTTSEAAVAFAFVRVIVSVEGAFAFTGLVPNDFAIVGATAPTVSVALAAAALSPFEVCRAFAAIVLV